MGIAEKSPLYWIPQYKLQERGGWAAAGWLLEAPGSQAWNGGTWDLAMVKTEQQFIQRGSRVETEHPVSQPLRK